MTMRSMTKNFAMALVAALVVLLAADPAAADVFSSVKTKGKELFDNVRQIIYIMGGFGLIGLAMGAIFGRINWKWFGGLAFGLIIIAVADAAVEYMTGSSSVELPENEF